MCPPLHTRTVVTSQISPDERPELKLSSVRLGTHRSEILNFLEPREMLLQILVFKKLSLAHLARKLLLRYKSELLHPIVK